MTTQTPAGGTARAAEPRAHDAAEELQTAEHIASTDEAEELDDDTEPFDDAELPEPKASGLAMGWILLVGGFVGLIGSAALAIERVLLAADPDYIPSCSFNPLISCGQVMESWQGKLFGFPNPFIGVGAFPVVMTFGVILLARMRPPRWMMLGLWGGTVLGAAFVTWLFTQSVYVIGALCPYCMVVWVAMIPTFIYTTGYVLSERLLPAPAGLRRAVVENRLLITIVWLLTLAIFITVEFWDRWYLVF